MKKIIYVLYLIALWVVTSFAQSNGYMETISIPDGLSNPNVQNVYQDRFGYIWIMTEDGLNRFDGSDIKIYRNDPDNPASLSNNSVYSAVEDTSGYLWIGSHAVVIRYDYATESFLAFPVAAMSDNERLNRIITLMTDSKGRVWAGTSIGTAHRLNLESNIFDFVPSVDNEGIRGISTVWDITELKNGKLLYADFQLGIYQYDESSGKFFKFLLGEDFSPEHIFRIQEDDDGLIWFSGEDQIIRYNPNFYSYQNIDEFQIQKPIFHLGFHKASPEDYIIVSDPFGMIRFNPKTSQITEKIRTSIPPYWFTSDKYGVMWIAGQGGLIKYDPNREPFRSTQISVEENQDERGGIITYLKLDLLNRNYIWLLSSENKLIRHDLTGGNNLSFDIAWEGRLNRFIQDRQGNFILGSNGQPGLIKYDIKTKKTLALNKITTTFNFDFGTRDLTFDQNNNLFLASPSGMIYYNFSDNNQFVLPTVTNRMYNTQIIETIRASVDKEKEVALITKAEESTVYNIDFSIKEDTHVLISCMGEGTFDGIGEQMYDYGLLKDSRDKTLFAMQDFSKTFHAGGGQKNRKQYEVLTLPSGDYNLKYIMDVGHSYNNFNTQMPADSADYGVQIYKITETDYIKIKNALAKELNISRVPIGVVNDIEVSRKYSNSIYISSGTQGLIRYNILDSSFVQYTFGELKSNNQKNFIQSLL